MFFSVADFFKIEFGLFKCKVYFIQFSVEISPLAWHRADVAALEILQLLLFFEKPDFVGFKLVINEFLCIGDVLSGAAEAAFREDGQQCLNHALRDIRTVVLIGDGVKVFAFGSLQPDCCRQTVVERLLLLGRLGTQIKVGHASHFLQVGTTGERSRHHGNLLGGIGLYGQSGQ